MVKPSNIFSGLTQKGLDAASGVAEDIYLKKLERDMAAPIMRYARYLRDTEALISIEAFEAQVTDDELRNLTHMHIAHLYDTHEGDETNFDRLLEEAQMQINAEIAAKKAQQPKIVYPQREEPQLAPQITPKKESTLRDIIERAHDFKPSKRMLLMGLGGVSVAAAGLFLANLALNDGVEEFDFGIPTTVRDVAFPIDLNSANGEYVDQIPLRIVAPQQSGRYCNAANPILFSGELHAIPVTNNDICDELLNEVYPAVGETIALNDYMSVTGLENGNIYFEQANQPDERNYEIPRENYNAIVEAWLISGGAEQRPLPFSYLMAKWRLESTHGINMGTGASVCGINQFKPGTFYQTAVEAGADHGLGRLRDAFIDLGQVQVPGEARGVTGISYPALVNSSDARAIFNSECRDLASGAVLGVRHSIHNLQTLQEMMNAGEIRHPYGSEFVTEKMGYMAQLLGLGTGNTDGAKTFFIELARDPSQLARNVIPADFYEGNKRIFHKDGRDLTLQEAYDGLSDFGFSDKAITNLEGWEAAPRFAPNVTVSYPDFQTRLPLDRLMNGNFTGGGIIDGTPMLRFDAASMDSRAVQGDNDEGLPTSSGTNAPVYSPVS